MTRERLLETDKYGDINIPSEAPHAVITQPRPGPAEPTAFTRGAALHGPEAFTGGFIYTPEPPAPAPYSGPVEVVGSTMPTGFAINNAVLGGKPPKAEAGHYALLSIGQDAAACKVDKFGDHHARKPSAIDLARANNGPVDSMQVEPSGFTRTKALDLLAYDVQERNLHPTQIALRRMTHPIEFEDVHAHKSRR